MNAAHSGAGAGTSNQPRARRRPTVSGVRLITRTLGRASLLVVALLMAPSCAPADTNEDAETPVILLGGGRSDVHLVPGRVVVRSGQRVRFTTVDRRVHTIRFAVDDMSPVAREFLESTGQLVSPPLLNRGAVFEVWFRDAPRGFYPFWAEGHGDPVEGVIVVE